MKKLLFAALFCLVTSFTAQAQTKEETIAWLTEKLMKTGFFTYTYYGFIEDVKIDTAQFDENFLILKGSTKGDKYYNGKVSSTYKRNFYYKIDLSKLEDYILCNANICSKNNSIKQISSWEKFGYKAGSWELLDLGTENEYTSRTYILEIVESVEPDIIERFKKAIKHYQSLMTIKKSAEKF